MPEQTVNPDVVVQRLMQAQLAMFRAEENEHAAKKFYNDAVADAAATIGIMKARILEQEEELKKKKEEKK